MPREFKAELAQPVVGWQPKAEVVVLSEALLT